MTTTMGTENTLLRRIGILLLIFLSYFFVLPLFQLISSVLSYFFCLIFFQVCDEIKYNPLSVTSLTYTYFMTIWNGMLGEVPFLDPQTYFSLLVLILLVLFYRKSPLDISPFKGISILVLILLIPEIIRIGYAILTDFNRFIYQMKIPFLDPHNVHVIYGRHNAWIGVVMYAIFFYLVFLRRRRLY